MSTGGMFLFNITGPGRLGNLQHCLPYFQQDRNIQCTHPNRMLKVDVINLSITAGQQRYKHESSRIIDSPNDTQNPTFIFVDGV